MNKRKKRPGNTHPRCQSLNQNSSLSFLIPISVFFHRLKAEEDRMKKEEDKARREFIKQEYLRRKQLKLMEDMDTLVKPRPAGAKQRKPRPKSIHRDVMESPRTPVRATAGKGRHLLAKPGTARFVLLLSSSLHPTVFSSNKYSTTSLALNIYSNKFPTN